MSGDCRGAVGEEPLSVVVIDPRTGHDLRSVQRADLLLGAPNENVDICRIDEAGFDEQALQCLDTNRRIVR